MLPIAFGLLMCKHPPSPITPFPRRRIRSDDPGVAPWGGHSVFPNIYRDMRHPKKFPKGLRVTYIFTVSQPD